MDLPIEYLIIPIWLLVCLFLQKNKLILYALIIYMACIAMFRGAEVGTDYPKYIDTFNYVTSENVIVLSGLESIELGFLYEMLFFKSFSDNPFAFYALQFLIFLGGFWYYCRYKKADYVWSLLLFFLIGFYFRSFNTIRQFMAIGLMMFCLPLVEEKKYYKFIIFTLIISIFFHLSGLIFLILLPIKCWVEKGRLNNRLVLGGLLISTYLLFFINHAFLYNVNLFGFLGERFNQYFFSGADREKVTNITATVYTLYALVVLFCSDFKNYKYEVTSFIFSVMIFNVLNLVNVHASRLALGIMIVICPLTCRLIQDKKSKYRLLFTLFSVAVGTALFVSQFVVSNGSEVKPYYSII